MGPSGTWAETTREEYFNGFVCPLWNDTLSSPVSSIRFSCSGVSPPAPFRRWVPSTSFSCQRLLDALPPNRTLFFLGDSMSAQHSRSAVCRLLQEAGAGAKLEHHAMRGSRFDHAVNPRIAHWQRKVPVCTRIGELIRAREGAALVTWRTVCWISCRANCAAFLFASMRRLRIVVPGDVVVVSEGVGLPDNETLAVALELARGYATVNATFRVNAALAASAPLHSRHRADSPLDGVRIVWREQSPQAFAGSPDGAYRASPLAAARVYAAKPKGKAKNSSGCGPLAQPARRPILAQVLRVLGSAGVPILPTHETAMSQWDVHLESRTPWVRAKVDCTHYCEPSGVLEAWNDGLACVLPAPPHDVGAVPPLQIL